MLEKTTKPMRAMILLGLNCGFGNTDCAKLPIDVIDWQGEWLDYARQKTGINRRCKLWPETVTALKDVLTVRKQPKDKSHAKLLFITKAGDSWASDNSSISKECEKLLSELEIKRPGLTFYTLRHTFQTIGRAAPAGPRLAPLPRASHAPCPDDHGEIAACASGGRPDLGRLSGIRPRSGQPRYVGRVP